MKDASMLECVNVRKTLKSLATHRSSLLNFCQRSWGWHRPKSGEALQRFLSLYQITHCQVLSLQDSFEETKFTEEEARTCPQIEGGSIVVQDSSRAGEVVL